MSNVSTGKLGEDIACEFLQKKGYEIIERNKKFSRFCELDIIAKERDTLVFVEVKTRKSDFCGSPFEAITKTKYDNIKTGAMYYLQEHRQKNYRIDAIAITLKPELKIEHRKNISIF